MKYLKYLATALLCLMIAVVCSTVYGSTDPWAGQAENEETEEISDASANSEDEDTAAEEEISGKEKAALEEAVSEEDSEEGADSEEETAAEEEPASEEAASKEETGSEEAAISEETSDEALETSDKGQEYLLSDFEIIYQYPELPTGCESVALTMLVNYYGVYADKLDMADNYLPKLPETYYYDENGNKIGPDMENYFVGDPRGVGHICGVPAIMTEADAWLEAQGSELRSVDKTGISFDDLYACIREGTPVMVWVTIYMADRRETTGWYTEDGRWMEYATNDHGAVLIGYSDTTVTIADPISGIVEYSRAQFEKVFASRGNKCIILQ